MKESNFYSDDFEQLIRDKTEQYKMYPSENVWKGVHSSLHTKRKWFIGSMAFLVTGILYFSGKELIAPSSHAVLAKKSAVAGASSSDGSINDLSSTDLSSSDPSKTNQSEELQHAAFVRIRPANTTAASSRHTAATGTSGQEDGQEEVDQPYKGLTITISDPVITQPDLSALLSHVVRAPGDAPTLIASKGTTQETAMVKATEDNHAEPGILDSWLVRSAPENPAARKVVDGATAARNNAYVVSNVPANTSSSKETGRESESEEVTARGVLESLSARGSRSAHSSGIARSGSVGAHTSVAADALKDSAGESTRASTAAIGEAFDRQRINWLHDYAMYTLPASPSGGRLFLQMTFAPTVNFRSLSGGNYAPSKVMDNAGPIATFHPGSPQNWVNHSPALGFEFGGNLLYRVTRNLTIKGGLQFNFSRFKILAYASSKPQQATNTLNTPYGYYNYMDSIISTTSTTSAAAASNFGSKTQESLNNDYYQLSAPIGFELRVLGNERLQFNIGATIQPSYLLNTNSYMLTSDYSYYTKEPSLYRRWNVSGGIEAFLSYQMGPVRWQVGPEFRYQLLSSYDNSQYPINENLKGYGLKIGITKQLP
jgi:hypothetical protein